MTNVSYHPGAQLLGRYGFSEASTVQATYPDLLGGGGSRPCVVWCLRSDGGDGDDGGSTMQHPTAIEGVGCVKYLLRHNPGKIGKKVHSLMDT